ncbi:MAG: DNA polymerase III subunit gamma/tau [Actinobacteria bacterium]|nr:DNA polymerase III subunit gamma/tau [Actinomycetota bacterium]
MAHVSLYRKYRPQTFAEIVGQPHVTETLSQAITEDRLHHAYLFTGPRGTGKTSTARILAKAVNCVHGPTPSPCNECAQCTSITDGANVDVIEIDAASHGGVDDVRDLRERVAFAPASARMKVYIVDECHMLSTAGWNAFLKTVEEPPDHVLFVFATTEPHKVLATILSRTQRFDFRRLDADTLAARVEHIGEREQISFDVGSVALIVRAGDGSARDTESVLEQVMAFTGPKVTVEGVTAVLGATDDDLLADMAGSIAGGDVAALCRLVQRLADSGHDLRQFTRDATEHLRVLFLLQSAPDADLVPGTAEQLARLRVQADRLGQIELLRAVDLLAECQAQMRRGNTRLPLELALAKAALPESSGDPAALGARLDRLERRSGVDQPPRSATSTAEQPATATYAGADAAPAGSAPAPSAVAPAATAPDVADDPAVTATPAPVTPDPAVARPSPGLSTLDAASPPASHGDDEVDIELLKQSWPAVLDRVKQQKVRWHALASMGRPVALDGQTVTLEFKAGHRFHAEECGGEQGQRIIGGAIHDVLGLRAQLRCTVATEDESTTAEDPEAAAVAEREAMEAAGELPDEDELRTQAIEMLRRNLGATVVDHTADSGPG